MNKSELKANTPISRDMQSDTIAAIATAPGAAGIAIVRISGPDSRRIARRIFTCPGHPCDFDADRTLRPGTIKTGTKTLDEVLLLIMRAPRSYTGEDVVEIQGHGGNITAQRILRLVIREGARGAEPGEFTQRAFLNGRLDLTQAEAVLDLISAQSERAADAALEQLAGKISTPLSDIHRQLLETAADIEASLDFSEDDAPVEILPSALHRLREADNGITALLNTWEEGRRLREGILIAISGRPNVGKSTLFNLLLDYERAITSPLPGTTRDLLEENCVINGYPARLADTAGLRATECLIEREGVRRARDLIRRTDLHLYMVDASQAPDPTDLENLARMPPDRRLVILNKTDLPALTVPADLGRVTVIKTALNTSVGLDEIKAAIIRHLHSSSAPDAPARAAISERHRSLLELARTDLRQAIQILNKQREDLLAPAATSIRDAMEQIGLILGKTYYPELLNAIFSRFCIGK